MLGAGPMVCVQTSGRQGPQGTAAAYLCQPAGLKHAGHQHDICSCIDEVGQGLAVHDE